MTSSDAVHMKPNRIEIRWGWVLFAILTLLTAIHVYLALHFPLSEDETYYWEWSRRLAWGYYDQSPGIAWVIRGFCNLFGDNEVGIRMGSILSSLLTQVIAFFLARDLFGKRAAFFSVVPFALSPIALAGGFLATYDSLLVLFWTAGLYFLSRCLFFGSRIGWLGVGICFGLGLQSKYLMALFGFCLLLYCVFVSGERKWLKSSLAWASFLFGSLLLLPNILWLSANGWITLSHVSNLTSKTTNKGFVTRFGDYLATQAAIVGPVCFLLFLAAAIWLFKRAKQTGSKQHWLIFHFSIPLFVLFMFETIRGEVIANWTATAWIAGSVAIGCYLEHLLLMRRVFAVRMYTICTALSLVVAILLIAPELAARVGITLPMNTTRQINKMYGGPELSSAVSTLVAEMENESSAPVGIAGTHYAISSRLAYYLPSKPMVGCLFLNVRLNQYIFWNESSLPPKGGNLLVVTSEPNDSPKRIPFEKIFDRFVECKPVDVYWREMYTKPVRTYYLFKCYGFHPRPELMTKPGERTGY